MPDTRFSCARFVVKNKGIKRARCFAIFGNRFKNLAISGGVDHIRKIQNFFIFKIAVGNADCPAAVSQFGYGKKFTLTQNWQFFDLFLAC